LRGTWIAVFVDGHFWHWCPGHGGRAPVHAAGHQHIQSSVPAPTRLLSCRVLGFRARRPRHGCGVGIVP
jgi:hypothetical protein